MKSACFLAAFLSAAASGALAAPQQTNQPATSATKGQPVASPGVVAVPVSPQVVAPIDLRAKPPLVCSTAIIGEKGNAIIGENIIGEKVIGEKIIGEEGSTAVIGEKVIGEEGSDKIIGEKVIGEEGSDKIIGEKSAGSKRC